MFGINQLIYGGMASIMEIPKLCIPVFYYNTVTMDVGNHLSQTGSMSILDFLLPAILEPVRLYWLPTSTAL